MAQGPGSSRFVRGSLLFVLAGTLQALFPSAALAIPAWSRKYDVACATCHYPAPPRLNVFGQKFRRAQYRLLDEFKKDADWKSVGNYLSMKISGGYDYDSPKSGFPGAGGVTSSFKLDEVSLFYAGPLGKNFSGWVELERPGDSSEIEVAASIGGLRGRPDSFWTFRLGQFHTLGEHGFGGIDRPTGITSPLAFAGSLVENNDFALSQPQVGVEGNYVHGNSSVTARVLNGANLFTGADGARTTDQADQNRDKDYFLSYELLWGSTASGLTVFGYDGRQEDLADPATPPGVVKVRRFGASAAQIFKGGLEVQGGIMKGKDDYSLTFPAITGANSIDGQGYWVELEQYLSKAKDLTVLARWDSVDPDTDVSKNSRTQITVGVVMPVADWHSRWALELRNIRQEDPSSNESFTDRQAAVELVLSF